ncbi:MAG: isocitrate/isopropylmalate dehydrogenase family protein [Candidatus Altiarchaeota archaeon]|nr:isocitrate/isopropylmalate dehydrogenase family protein [Candidatus Altiarchaeota archaeon]
MHVVTLIPGDGIGPEVAEATVRVVEATGVDIRFESVDAGERAMESEGTPLPQSVFDSIQRNKVAIKGPITTPVGSGFRSVNVALRHALDLYACLRPAKSFKGILSRYEDIDLVMVRENTEDIYAGIEFDQGTPEADELITVIERLGGGSIRANSAISIKPISRFASERIVRFAFDYAVKNGRGKVTAVHKANIMKATDGLFLDSARKVARDYPGVEFEDRIVDNMCMQLVKKPELYDVLVAPNLFGDIISDLCAGLVGGLGIAPGANIGDELAVFEPVHGSAPKYAGLDKVNPSATILSGVLMLRHLGEVEAADRIENALAEVFSEGRVLTYDLGGSAKTSEFTDYVISKL